MKKVISLSLDEALVAKIDSDRGRVARSPYVEDLLIGRISYAPDYDSKPSSQADVVTPGSSVGTDGPGNTWRCKHRSCSYTSPKVGRCKFHNGSLIRVDRPDQLIP